VSRRSPSLVTARGYGSEAELIAAVRERKGKKGLMRPIKFRGKPTATVWQDYWQDYTDETLFYEDEFVYGSLVVSGDDCYIVGDVIDCTEDSLELEWWVKVRPETVGQYTVSRLTTMWKSTRAISSVLRGAMVSETCSRLNTSATSTMVCCLQSICCRWRLLVAYTTIPRGGGVDDEG